MLLINSGTIVLIITSTIMLMKNKEREPKYRDISILAFTTTTIKTNPNI